MTAAPIELSLAGVSVWRAVLGWSSALMIGGGGAYAISQIPPPALAARTVSAPPALSDWIDVTATGQVEQHTGDGWIPLATTRLFGGLRARTSGRDATLSVKTGSFSASASLDAELVISALADPMLSLESGQVTLSSESGAAVFVPSFGVWLRGAKFGALLDRGRLSVASLAELEITKPGHRPELFPAGQEILIHGDELRPFLLGSELRVLVEKQRKRLSAQTSPAALLMVETESGIDVIAPDEAGRAFLPEHRSVVAVDALGRVASAVPVSARRGKRRVAATSDDDAIPLSIPMGSAALGRAEIAKPEAALPELVEEQSALEEEMGDLDEETREAVRDF